MKRTFSRIIAFILVIFSFNMSISSCKSTEISENEKNEVIGYLRDKIYETLPYSDDMVFWVKGGSVYHLYKDCRFLEKAEEVRYGTIAKSGRVKLCETCAKRSEATEDSSETVGSSETKVAVSEAIDNESVFDGVIVDIAPLEVVSSEGDEEIDRSIQDNVGEETAESDENNAQTVYWTPNGSVWHVDPNCSSLSKSKDVRSGTIEESGKDRACKKCSP